MVLFFSGNSSLALPGDAKNKTPFPVKYSSIADQNIILRTITLAPVYDNLNGIYATPIQKLLVDLLQNDKTWGYAEVVGHDKNKFIEEYDSNPNDVIEVLSKTKVQGLMTAFITKGPRGINAKLKLFTHDQGFLLAEESIEDLNAFEISRLRQQFVQMYQNLKNKLPYRGFVLSRRGLEVTLSLGSINGIKEGQELTLAQIIKLNRHPKLKFIVGVEKEIIAKVVITKADTYLSFAQITFEKETGVVDFGAKVLPTEYISYPVPDLDQNGEVIGESADKSNKEHLPQLATPVKLENEESNAQTQDTPESDKAASEHREALFDRHNTSGVLTFQGLLTQYSETNSLVNGTEASAKNSFSPGAYVGGLLYIFNDMFLEGSYELASFGSSNGLSGSNPANLSFTYNKASAAIGYDYVFEAQEADERAIKFTGLISVNNLITSVTNTTPVALTSTETLTINLTFKASTPVSNEMPLVLGGRFDLPISTTFSESPVNSGSASTTVTSFGFFGVYNLNEKYNLRADFNILNINNHFSGSASRPTPAGSGKQEYMTEKFGIEYLF